MPQTDIDGERFRHLIIAASQSVLRAQEHLNAINVFPVADADTGTNLALTLRSAADGARRCADPSVDRMCLAVADAALAGAHGCSGAIVSQFLQGMSDALHGTATADLRRFAEAACRGAALAREAVAEPKDGTILTVMRDWAGSLAAGCDHAHDVTTLFADSVAAASTSLHAASRTLSVPAGAGVVDAGGLGFVVMLDGMLSFLQSGRLDTGVARPRDAGAPERHPDAPAAIPFGFCTSVMIEGPSIDRGALRQRLLAFGDSQIVVGSGRRVQVHIHSNDPEGVCAVAQEYGQIVDRRIEDMRAQHARADRRAAGHRVALVMDSAGDLPPDETIVERIRIVPLRISFGTDSYLDKITLSDRDFYQLLATHPAHPTTSQPTAAQFRDAYLEASSHQREAIVVTVSAALSGTFQTAVAAADAVKERIDVSVVDSKSVSAGIGLILREAIDAIESGATRPEILQRVRWAVEHVRVYATVETVEHLVRGGRLSRARGRLARWLNLRPVLTLDGDGKVRVVAKALTAAGSRRRLMAILGRAAPGRREWRCLIAHADAVDLAGDYADEIRRRFGVDDISIVPMSAVFGAHVGPGAIAVAVLAREQ